MEVTIGEHRRQEVWEALQIYPRNSAEGAGYGNTGFAVGPIRYQNIHQFLARFFLSARFEHELTRNWREMCIGVRTAIMDKRAMVGGHLPMLDYDGRHIKTALRQDVDLAQREFGLGEATIYRTRRGFHVYFLHDTLPWVSYLTLLQRVNCCPGFRQSVERNQCGVLRVSSKYTDFDIYPAYTVPDPQRRLRRDSPKAVLVKTLLGMGAQHQTHLAGLFPQWASYHEDTRPWKPRRKVPLHSKGKYIKKTPENTPAELKIKELQKKILELPNPHHIASENMAVLDPPNSKPQVKSAADHQKYQLYFGTVSSSIGYGTSSNEAFFSWPKAKADTE